ncbi:hypothetical protein NET02_11550 [Thermomicrobiaceae bacterium CFH 74404]|uniref:Uncharacterized protein n=1 Tax=Thermalbibacter longus TaxID=2951981 RepID=A0AA41WG59_9BACT|nr:hypothetical protein [Thermalbibacter longus]MCM8749785.1 hypothetical protein [Thermalbibacter longus]
MTHEDAYRLLQTLHDLIGATECSPEYDEELYAAYTLATKAYETAFALADRLELDTKALRRRLYQPQAI